MNYYTKKLEKLISLSFCFFDGLFSKRRIVSVHEADGTRPLLLYEAIHSCLADLLICPNVTRVGRLVHNWHHIITCENCKRDYEPNPLMGKRKCDERSVCWDGEMLTPGLCELQKRWGWENHQRDLFLVCRWGLRNRWQTALWLSGWTLAELIYSFIFNSVADHTCS